MDPAQLSLRVAKRVKARRETVGGRLACTDFSPPATRRRPLSVRASLSSAYSPTLYVILAGRSVDSPRRWEYFSRLLRQRCMCSQDSAPLVPSSLSFGPASHSKPQGSPRDVVLHGEDPRPWKGVFCSFLIFFPRTYISSKRDAIFVAEGMVRTSVSATVPLGRAASGPRRSEHRTTVRVRLQYRRFPAQIREERYLDQKSVPRSSP